MKKSIVAFGELLWDILPNRTVLGGAVFNLAYRLQSLGDDVVFISALGEDMLGAAAQEQLTQLGMSDVYLQSNSWPTGQVNVSLTKDGVPDFHIVPNVAYDFIEPTSELLQAASAADCLCFGTLAQRAPRSRKTLHALIKAAPQAIKFLDINLRKTCYSEETVRWSLAAADILKLNDAEVRMIIGLLRLPDMTLSQLCDHLTEAYLLDCVVITLGEKGVFAQSADDRRVYVPGHRIQVADTVGAGDACAAGFLHAWLQGKPLTAACKLGNALGALVATTHGATKEILPEQIETLLREGGERIVSPALRHLIEN